MSLTDTVHPPLTRLAQPDQFWRASEGAPASERLRAACVAGERPTRMPKVSDDASKRAPASERLRAACVAGER